MRALLLAAAGVLTLGIGAANAADEIKVPHLKWGFHGAFGTYDRAALQRGFQVYKEVCSVCHSVDQLYFRTLGGGPGGSFGDGIGYDAEQVKALAESYDVPDIGEDGQPNTRKGRASDKIPKPFANEKAARAGNNGALPPDLSLITKARVGGEDYVHAILNGYEEPPADFKLQSGMNYNKYFPGHQIAMPKPLEDGRVTFADNTPATVEQMSRDVSTFLAWAAEPSYEDRKQTGIKVILFLVVMTVLLYFVKRKVWADLH